MLKLSKYNPRLRVEIAGIRAEEQQEAGVITEPDEARGRFGHCVVGILSHPYSIPVAEGVAFVAERFLHHPREPLTLLPPIPAENPDADLCGRRIERDEAIRPAIGNRELIQEVENPGEGLGWIARDRERSDVKPAHARLEASDEILAPDHVIQIDRHARDTKCIGEASRTRV